MKLKRRGFRDLEAPDLTIARNEGAARGARVTVPEVSAYALPLHPPCRGKGYSVTFRRYASREEVPAGTPEDHIESMGGGSPALRVKLAVPCKCATKRFLKAHPEVVLDAAGIAWWPLRRGVQEP